MTYYDIHQTLIYHPYTPLLHNRPKDPPTRCGQPVNTLLVQLDCGAELLLILKQLCHVHVDVLSGAVVPLELCHCTLKEKWCVGHNLINVNTKMYLVHLFLNA